MAQSLQKVWDGTSMVNNCSDATQTYWTYNVGTMIMGAAYMANFVSILMHHLQWWITDDYVDE